MKNPCRSLSAGSVLVLALLLAILPAGSVYAGDEQDKKSGRLRDESRVWIVRGLQSEFCTLRKALPRGAKGLPMNADGKIDDQELLQRITNNGVALRPGDLVQITRIDFREKEIIFEINGGGTKKRKWYQNIEVGMGRTTRPIDTNQSAQIPAGSSIALAFNRPVPDVTVDDLKQMLTPVLDFTRRSASVLYTESLPKEIQEAIKNHQVLVDMDKDMVLAAKGRPDRKIRESHGRRETEDWVYGTPPSKITLVTFEGNKVIEVKELVPGVASEAARAMESKDAPPVPAGQPASTPAPTAPAPAPTPRP